MVELLVIERRQHLSAWLPNRQIDTRRGSRDGMVGKLREATGEVLLTPMEKSTEAG